MAVTRFGVFEVDIRAGELRHNGVKVKFAGAALPAAYRALGKTGRTDNPRRSEKSPVVCDTFVDFDTA